MGSNLPLTELDIALSVLVTLCPQLRDIGVLDTMNIGTNHGVSMRSNFSRSMVPIQAVPISKLWHLNADSGKMPVHRNRTRTKDMKKYLLLIPALALSVYFLNLVNEYWRQTKFVEKSGLVLSRASLTLMKYKQHSVRFGAEGWELWVFKLPDDQNGLSMCGENGFSPIRTIRNHIAQLENLEGCESDFTFILLEKRLYVFNYW